MKVLRLLPLFMLISLISVGQQLPKDDQYYRENPEWRNMMKQKDVNLKEVKQAFKLYMEGREKKRGTGWKMFERWAFKMSFFADENGNLPQNGKSFNAYQEFLKLNQGKAPMGQWTQIGPKNLPSPLGDLPSGLGRINTVAFHPTEADILYAGAPSGGFWMSTNGGDDWVTTTDNLPSIGVSAIVVSKDNPNEIYIGTGDRDAGDASGLGVFKSTDGGLTWKQMNNGMGNKTVNRLLQNSINPNVIIAGTNGGVFKTYDRGQTWIQSEGINSAWDMEYKPGDTTTVYAAQNGAFKRSIDGGATFSTVSLPLGSARTAIAVTPANPNLVYCVLTTTYAFRGFVKSTNSGETFTVQSESPNILGYANNGSDGGGQAYYDLAMDASPTNEDLVVVGGINTWRTTNGGTSWSLVGYWTSNIHADQHEMAFSPHNGKLYIGNDGGFYEAGTNGSGYDDLSSGMEISQMYKMGQSPQTRELVITGHQDNGTSTYTGTGWVMSIGGDGMECMIDPFNDQIRYGALYYGDIRRSKTGNSYFAQVAPLECYNSNTGDYTGLWVTPYCLNEFNSEYMYAGYDDVWRADNIISANGQYYVNWENITPNESFPGKVRVVEASSSNENIFFFCNEAKKLYCSTNVNDDNPEWSVLSGFGGTVLNDMETIPTSDSTLYVATNTQVYVTEDLGQTWVSLTADLPDVTFTSVAYDPSSDGGIYVGSDMGVFYRSNKTNGWEYFSRDFPVSSLVTELEVFTDSENPSESRLRASTYGRGLWESPLYDNGFENDIMVSAVSVPDAAQVNDTYYPEVTIKNMGSTQVSNIEVTYQLNNGVVSTETVTEAIDQFGTATVSFPEVILTGAGSNLIVAKVSYTGETVDESPMNNRFEVNFNVAGEGLPAVDFAGTPAAANIGETIQFEASVDGSADDYIWDFGMNASPQTTTGIGPHDVSYSTGGSKDVVLKVVVGSDSLFVAKANVVTIYSEPVVVNQPQGTTICQSEDVILQVDAEGDALEYQWKFNGEAIGGATQKYFAIYNGQPEESGDYTCEVSNPSGSVESSAASVTINATPQIEVSVDNDVLCSGESATITVSGGDTYEWSDDLGTGSTVVVTPGSTRSYYVTATSNGCISVAEVPIIVPTNISVQPNEDVVEGCEGGIVTLSVDANGDALEFQWYRDGEIIDGAIDYAYSIADASESDNGDYTCVASNRCYTEESSVIALQLSTSPDADFFYVINGLVVEFYNTSDNADSYQWQFQGGGSSTQESPVYTFPEPGVYFVRLTAYNQCGEDDKDDYIDLTGINDGVFSSIVLHPNPNNGEFQFQVTDEMAGDIKIEIVDANGRVVYTEKETYSSGLQDLKDISLTEGLYLFKLYSNNKKFSTRFIVE
jgi:photosystem II stability/assembly factor-like uncharacterized protein